MKKLLETMCGGNFITQNLDEVFQFLDYIVEVSRSWEDHIIKEQLRDKGVNIARANGVYTLLRFPNKDCSTHKEARLYGGSGSARDANSK